MAENRVVLPATSLASALIIGLGTAMVTIATVHPEPQLGAASAGGAVVGSVLFATGLVLMDRGGPFQDAIGGIVVFLAVLLLIGAAVLVSLGEALIVAIAAGLAIAGVVLLSLVMVGYADPASLGETSDIMVRWMLVLLAVSAGVGLLTMVPHPSVVAMPGTLLQEYVVHVSDSQRVASGSILIHVMVLLLLSSFLLKQLVVIEFLGEAWSDRILSQVQKAIIVGAFLVLGPWVLANTPAVMTPLTRQIPRMAAGLATAGTVVQAPLLQHVILAVEVVLLVGILVCLLLQFVRTVAFDTAVLYAGFVTGPVVVILLLVVAFRLALEVAGPDLFAPVHGAPGSLPLAQKVAVAALLASGLFMAVLVIISLLQIVLETGYRFESRGLPAAASAGLFTGAAFMGLTGVWPPIVAGCLVGALLTWDVLENGIGLGEQLHGRFNAVPNEFAHLSASGLVAGLALVVGLGTYQTSLTLTTGATPSVIVVGLLLAASVVFALLLRRL